MSEPINEPEKATLLEIVRDLEAQHRRSRWFLWAMFLVILVFLWLNNERPFAGSSVYMLLAIMVSGVAGALQQQAAGLARFASAVSVLIQVRTPKTD